MPSSYAKILAKSSYGEKYIFEDCGPFQLVLQNLMQQKSQSIYPIKQFLILTQLDLLELTQLLKEHSGDIEKTKKTIDQIKLLKQNLQNIIKKINRLDSEFKAYSNNLINHAKTNLPKRLNKFINEVEKLTNNKLTTDIKLLFFDKNGLPLSQKNLKKLMIERGVSNDQ